MRYKKLDSASHSLHFHHNENFASFFTTEELKVDLSNYKLL